MAQTLETNEQLLKLRKDRKVLLFFMIFVLICLLVGGYYFVRAFVKYETSGSSEREQLQKTLDQLQQEKEAIKSERIQLQAANALRNKQAERIMNELDKIDTNIANLEKRQNEAIRNVTNMSDADLQQYFTNLQPPTE